MNTHETVRIILQKELARRCETNPRYSLRAFAKALGISHPLLSLVLSGKRRLSKKSAVKIAEKLPLLPYERQFFLGEMEFEEGAPKDHHQIDIDTFSLISDWFHYAILSLLNVRGARFEAGWISKRLNISLHEARDAMERLVRLGLVEQQGQCWKQTGLPIKVENAISTAASQKFHRQLMQKAIHSLENDSRELQNFSSMTLTMDPEMMNYAIEKIKKFRRILAEELEKAKPGKEVYNLTIQLFPVSRSPDAEGENQ
jgi:transcriptional regulator with XRE-family HTH domain